MADRRTLVQFNEKSTTFQNKDFPQSFLLLTFNNTNKFETSFEPTYSPSVQRQLKKRPKKTQVTDFRN